MFDGGGPKVDLETLWRVQRLTLAETYGVAPHMVDEWPAQDVLDALAKLEAISAARNTKSD